MIITNLEESSIKEIEYIRIQFDSQNYVIFEFNPFKYSCRIVNQLVNRHVLKNINFTLNEYHIYYTFLMGPCPSFYMRNSTILLQDETNFNNTTDMLLRYKDNIYFNDRTVKLIYMNLYESIKTMQKLF